MKGRRRRAEAERKGSAEVLVEGPEVSYGSISLPTQDCSGSNVSKDVNDGSNSSDDGVEKDTDEPRDSFEKEFIKLSSLSTVFGLTFLGGLEKSSTVRAWLDQHVAVRIHVEAVETTHFSS